MYHFDTDQDKPPVPEWVQYAIGELTLIQVVFWLIATISLIALVIKLWPAVSKFVQIINATAGLPKFIQDMEARLVLDDSRHEDLTQKVSEIHHEVHYNNGTSVKDGIRRIEIRLEDLTNTDNELRKELERTAQAGKNNDHQ